MRYQDLINGASSRYGIPNDILTGLVRAESGGNPNAVSPKGAVGLTQIMPGTARDLGVDPRDPAQAIDGGARYLKQQYDRFGDWPTALAAYNAGPGRVAKAGGIPNIRETKNYVSKITGGANMAQPEFDGSDIFGRAASPAPQQMGGGQEGFDGADIFAATKPVKAAPTALANLPRKAPRSIGQDIVGGLANLNRGLLVGDEMAAGLGTAINATRDALQGKQGPGWADRFKGEMARQRQSEDTFATAHPVAAPLIRGTGTAATLLLPGGAATKAIPAGANLATRAGLSAVAAAPAGAAYGALDRGSVRQRLNAANNGGMLAAAAGGAAPLIAAGVKAVGGPVLRTTARAANKLTGGRLLDPEGEALRRLGNAMKADGLSPAEIRAAQAEWTKSGGSSPALLDVGGENTRALVRAAASGGPARNTAVGYADQVAADLQDNVINRTRQLTPDQRPAAQVADELQGRITQAAQMGDQVAPGSGGVAVSDALNARFNAAKSQVDEAYSVARAASPEKAHIPAAERPNIAATLREAVADFDPQGVPRVTAQLNGLDNPGPLTVRDMFDLRTRLGNLRISNDPVEASAAGRLVSQIDNVIDDVVDRGVVTGDPNVVNLWRDAIAQRRQFGQQFQGEDMIQALTERERRGGAMVNAVAPEDASNVALGRSGVANRPNTTRDLGAIRQRLGQGSAWDVLRREGQQRVLGRDAGTENFGTAWTDFERQNPQLANLLMTPSERAQLTARRGMIGSAAGQRDALALGSRSAFADPESFARGLDAASARTPDARNLAGIGLRSDLVDAIGAPAEGSTGFLNRLATGRNSGQVLESTFGPDAAGSYRKSVGQEIDRLRNARYISPNTSSQTASRLDDLAGLSAPPRGLVSMGVAIIDKIRRGASMTDQERQMLVQLGTGDPAEGLRVLETYIARTSLPKTGPRVIQSQGTGAVAGLLSSQQ